MKKFEELNERAAAISGALTGSVLHLLLGSFAFSKGFGMMGYGMMQYSSFGLFGGLASVIFGLIAGGFVGWLIAVTYNWGLRK